MTLSTVAVNDPVLASTHQQIIAKVNASPGRQVFLANGTFSVPTGIHKFRVFIAGGGQGGYDVVTMGMGEDSYLVDGAAGNDSFLVSADYSGVDIGTSFAVVVGAGGAIHEGAGGTSSFGAFSITGASGAGRGTVTPPGGSTPMYHMNGLYCNNTGIPYGTGGNGGTAALDVALPGTQGIVVVEW